MIDAAFAVAFHSLSDFEAARDAAQEALVAAYLELPTLRDPSRFANWLCGITTRTALTYARRRRCTTSLDAPEAVERPSLEPGPAEAVERSEEARKVREALLTLPEPDRLAVTLHYVDGYSHEEVGSILGASVSSVKSRLHRARCRLRKEMLHMVEYRLKDEVRGVILLPPLGYYLSKGDCDPRFRDILEVKITGSFGRSPKTAPGETYVVCGEYVLKEPGVNALRLLVSNGTASAHYPPLAPGTGRFELRTDILEVKREGNRTLLLEMVDENGQSLGIHT